MKFSANLASFKKSLKKIEIFSLVIFAIFLIFPFKIPASLAKLINNPLGVLIIFIIAVVLFVKSHIIVSILFLMVAYELIRRSGVANKIKPANSYNGVESTSSPNNIKMNPLPGVNEINDLNNNYMDNYNIDNSISLDNYNIDNSISVDPTLENEQISLTNYTMNPDFINNYASIGINSKEHQQTQANLSVGSTLEEEVIKERIPADALHTSNNSDTFSFVPVYDNSYYDVSPI